MPYQIDFSLLGAPVDVGAAVTAGFERGRQTRRQTELDRALHRYSASPGDPAALAAISSIDPRLAISLEEAAYQRGEHRRQAEGRSAFSSWLIAQGRGPQASAFSALTPPATGPASPDLGASAPVAPQRGMMTDPVALPADMGAMGAAAPAATPSALAPVTAPPGPSASALSPSPRVAAPPADDFSSEEFQRFARADPEAAMRAVLGRHQITREQNQALAAQYDTIARLAGSATDQASYEAALAEAQRLGLDVSGLPPDYTAEHVDSIRRQALSAREYLAEQRAERRLEWDIEDDQTDNEALSDYRERSLDVRRRGQDIGHADRVSDPRRVAPDRSRGGPRSEGAVYADIMARWTRGEPVNGREREFVRSYEQRHAPSRNRGRGRGRGRGNAGSAGSSAAIITNPRTGERMHLEGGRWVPIR